MKQMSVQRLLSGATLAVAVTLGSVSGAMAQTALVPGGTVAPPPTVAAATLTSGYTFVTSESSSFSATNGSNTIAGILVSALYKKTSDNTLAFFYQLSSSGSSTGISSLSIASFGDSSVTTSVAQTTDNIGVSGFTAGTVVVGSDFRESSGEGIFFQGFSLVSGQTTLSQFVKTSALTFTPAGSAAVLGGGVSDNLTGLVLAPNVVSAAPEPGSLALVATGLMSTFGMIAVRRRRAA